MQLSPIENTMVIDETENQQHQQRQRTPLFVENVQSQFKAQNQTPTPQKMAEDDAELFGKRVANFLRRLEPKKSRRACIEFEKLMLDFES